VSEVKTTKPSDSDAVDRYMAALKHPLAGLAQEVRRTILATDPAIGEEIKWNAPAFFYTGAMKSFNPKEYRRHLVVFNFYRKDSLRLVFWHGDRAHDTTGLLEGSYPDGRRLATLECESDLRSKKKALQAALKGQLERIGE
jgi:hypothetical protein